MGKRANPGPLGLLGFALTTALLQGGITHITEVATTQVVYGMALAFGGAAQALAGIFELAHGTTLGGVAFVTYGAFWIGWACNKLFVAAALVPPPPAHGEQFFLGLWGLVTFFFFCASLCVNMMLQFLFCLLSIVFWLLCAGVTHPMADRAGGWIGLVVAGIAFYGAAAELLNEHYRKTVLPLGVCKPGHVLLPYLQRAIGAIPLLGPIYMRAVEHEDQLAGFTPYPDQSYPGPMQPSTAAATAAAHIKLAQLAAPRTAPMAISIESKPDSMV